MKKALFALVVLVSLVAAAADRTTVVVSSKSEATSVGFNLTKLADGGTPVDATVCGRTIQIVNGVDAGYTSPTCWSVTLPQNHAIALDVKALVATDGGGAALNYWKTQESL